MKAEIIAVGSELLTPDRLDTNSLYLTDKLNAAGYEVHLKSVVGDNAADLEALLLAALRRSRLIVLCGGLGPTEDDLTRAATARALGRRLTLNVEILEALRLRFASRGYPMPAINERQAELIAGAESLPNPAGSAPGMWIEEQQACLVLLPGPPREMQAVYDAHVQPRLLRLAGGRHLEKRSLGIQGLTESDVDTRVAPIYLGYPGIQTTILAAAGCIQLRFQQWLEPGQSRSELDEVTARIRAELGAVVYTTASETLEEVVGGLLRGSGQTLAVAESCTAGLLGATLARVPGSSDYFLGGLICYSNDLKTKLCGVPPDLLAQCGAVSAEVAEAMARGVCEAAGSSIGLSITGIAGPGGGSEQKPVGLVFFGLADVTRCLHIRRVFPGGRQMVREFATTFALGRLRRFLLPTEGKT